MIIRPLLGSDAEKLEYFRKKDFEEGWNREMIISAFDSGRFYGFVAEENGEVIGFITVDESADATCDIESVYTVKERRNKGVGTALIENVVKKAKNGGFDKIFLEVNAQNPAFALYLKLGFIKVSVRKKYYSDGNDAIVMVKELK